MEEKKPALSLLRMIDRKIERISPALPKTNTNFFDAAKTGLDLKFICDWTIQKQECSCDNTNGRM